MPHPFVYHTYNMEKKFSKYLNSTCNPDEFAEVIKAICSDDNKDNVSTEILKLWEETLNTAIENKENSQLLDKIHHRIALEESGTISRRFTWYRNLLKVAAVLILGLITTTIVFYNKPEKLQYASIVETVTTPYGARTNFKLPDGSEVWLNSGSTISFPKQYDKIRNVRLVGQAYFKVLKDGKPFVVKTAYGNVEVTGTAFDVKAYKDENFETTLVEGIVNVRDRKNQVANLKPGEQSVITPANEFTINNVNTELSTSWREGRLIFVNEPFQNVAKALERWYNVKIELQGEKLKKLGYTGTIEMETFVEVLELINTTTSIKYKFDKNTRILKISGR